MNLVTTPVPVSVPGDWLGPETPQHWWCVRCGAWARCDDRDTCGRCARSARPLRTRRRPADAGFARLVADYLQDRRAGGVSPKTVRIYDDALSGVLLPFLRPR